MYAYIDQYRQSILLVLFVQVIGPRGRAYGEPFGQQLSPTTAVESQRYLVSGTTNYPTCEAHSWLLTLGIHKHFQARDHFYWH